MTLTLDHQDGTPVLEVGISGKLAVNDYELLSGQVKRMLKNLRDLRLLVSLRRFDEWEDGSKWEEVPTSIRHLRDVQRLAVVGDMRWKTNMEEFGKPFRGAEVKYFSEAQLDLARAWLESRA